MVAFFLLVRLFGEKVGGGEGGGRKVLQNAILQTVWLREIKVRETLCTQQYEHSPGNLLFETNTFSTANWYWKKKRPKKPQKQIITHCTQYASAASPGKPLLRPSGEMLHQKKLIKHSGVVEYPIYSKQCCQRHIAADAMHRIRHKPCHKISPKIWTK